MQRKHLPSVLEGRVLVTGAGVSGVGAARLLASLGVNLVLADARPSALTALESEGIRGVLTDEVALDAFDAVVTSPGWRPDSPLLAQAAERGLPVIGDVEMAYQLDAAGVFGAPRTWLAVTGTNGKTTTTAMLTAMMQHSGARAEAVGNIGVSVAEAVAGPRIDVLVAELSSFQLHWSSSLHPEAGVLLNLAEDHLDWHGSFEAYALDKAKVWRSNHPIAGIDDPTVARLAGEHHATAGTPAITGFTLGVPDTGQLGVVEGRLVSREFGDDDATDASARMPGGAGLDLGSAEHLQPAGPAGVLDALAAAAVARSQGVNAQVIAEALERFEVAGHRGQVVDNAAGLLAIDNSKATNPHAADAALEGHSNVVWVAGGQLKGAEVDDLVRKHAGALRAAALIGVDRHRIAQALHTHAPQARVLVVDSTDPEAAMRQAVDFAVWQAGPTDAIILAPAAASLDMYSGMAQRGDLFATHIRRAAQEKLAQPANTSSQAESHSHSHCQPPQAPDARPQHAKDPS